MVISVEKTRKIMGPANKKYSNAQIEELINVLSAIANFAIDSYIEEKRKRKEKANETNIVGRR